MCTKLASVHGLYTIKGLHEHEAIVYVIITYCCGMRNYCCTCKVKFNVHVSNM